MFTNWSNNTYIFMHKGMFTNWLNKTYIILIICPFNFCSEYCSPSYSHFTSNYTGFFLTSIFLCRARSLFILKLLPWILPSMFLTPILCLQCLLLLWLDGPGLLAAPTFAAWRLRSATILAIIFVRAIFFILYNKWFYLK